MLGKMKGLIGRKKKDEAAAASPATALSTPRDLLRLDEAALHSLRQLGVDDGARSKLYLLRRRQLLAMRAFKQNRRRASLRGGGGRNAAGGASFASAPASAGAPLSSLQAAFAQSESLLNLQPVGLGGADLWSSYCDWRPRLLRNKFAMQVKAAEEKAYTDAAAAALHRALMAEHMEKEIFEDDGAGPTLSRNLYRTLRPLQTFNSARAASPVAAVRFPPDNDNIFAAGAMDGSVSIYSARPARLLRVSQAHSQSLTDLDWGTLSSASSRASDDEYSAVLVTTSLDQTACVWTVVVAGDVKGRAPPAVSLQCMREINCRAPVTFGRVCLWDMDLCLVATCKLGVKSGVRSATGQVRDTRESRALFMGLEY